MKSLRKKSILLGAILSIIAIVFLAVNLSQSGKSQVNVEQSFTDELFALEATLESPKPYYGSADEFRAEFVGLWKTMKAYTLEVAEAMPADKYDFRPDDSVRTFAQQLKHLSYANMFFVKVFFMGEQVEFDQTIEQVGMSKEEVIAFMNESFDLVLEKAENINDEMLNEQVEIFLVPVDPKPMLSRRQMFVFMRDHVTHHRGQAIVYLRVNGIVPPQYRAF